MDITIQSRAGIQSFYDDAELSLLFAGLAQGITLPYECATGTCGTCRARLVSGSVESLWLEAPALAKLRRDKGDILMCQSRATGACVLRVPGEVTRTTTVPRPAQHRGTIRSMERLTGDVTHFDIDLVTPMSFDPGQFVVVTTPGLTGGRAYSMVNHTGAATALSLVVKRKSAGGFSDWLFGSDVTGAELALFGPLGRAVFRPEEDRDIVCIAGGSGIAGMMSMLEHANAIDYFSRRRGHVFFGVRTLADGFYLDRLSRHVEAARGGLNVVLALSDEIAPAVTHPQYPRIQLMSGFVHEAASARMSGQLENVCCFVSGPPPMVDGALRMLITQNVNRDLIRYDKFG